MKNKKYQELIKKSQELESELNELEKETIIQYYLELKKEQDTLNKKIYKEYEILKKEEYNNCNHILVYSSIEDYKCYDNRQVKYAGCIKCGLDRSVLSKSIPWSCDTQIMYDYFTKDNPNMPFKGISTKMACDIELGKAIYQTIKEEYPNIEDKLAVEYFIKCLEDVRNTDANKKSRLKRSLRLKLGPTFERWNEEDVYY